MKTIVSLSTMSALLIAAAISTPLAASESVKATVNGMVCAFCAQGIEKRMTNMPTTKAVYVNLDKKLVAVEAKDGQKLDLEKIKAEITDAGYDVVKLETVAMSVDAIKASAKK